MKYFLAHAATLFGVELGCVEIVALKGCAEGRDVMGCSYGPGALWYVETVDEVYKLVARESFEQWCLCVSEAIPSHVGDFVLVMLGLEAFHINVEDSQALRIAFFRIAAP